MKAWQCKQCGARVTKKTIECPLCKRKEQFIEIELSKPDPNEEKYTKIYDGVIKQLELYDKGTPKGGLKETL
jgi:predicted ATP-dependent serine protease